MDEIKLILRIIVSIIILPIFYPIGVAAASLMGIGIMLGTLYFFTYPIHWLGNNEEGMKDSKEAGIMVCYLFAYPIIVLYKYIKEGEFYID